MVRAKAHCTQAALFFYLIAFYFLVLAMPAAQAQTFTVLHSFTGRGDGSNPVAGITVGGAGTIYGTASLGAINGNGVVFRMTREGIGWVLQPLHEFTGGDDGSQPMANVVFGPDGALYGTTDADGSGNGGTLFRMTPPQTACKSALCYWNETVLYAFADGPGGSCPWFGTLVFDDAGNIYGTTYEGGVNSSGVAYKLSPSGGQWTETVLHSFSGGDDGLYPQSGVVFDAAGNLYGSTTYSGGNDSCINGCGIVYQLSPSGSAWVENILTNFSGVDDGSGPLGSVILDPSGNVYSTTSTGGSNGGGTVFELTSLGQWNFSSLYSFTGQFDLPSGLAMDDTGNLYGVTYNGGLSGKGMVFKLTNSDGTWMLHDLHDFTGGSDGANPVGTVTPDSNGNLYGTTYSGGLGGSCTYSSGCGVVWEIMP
jgi:uncharacterized repeat protein (TIGR03803 family)